MASKDLLVIDQAPLFSNALAACQRNHQSIEKMRAELHRYERSDLPAYERWSHATFGKYLTGIRELTAIIREKESQLESARKRHWDRFFGSAPFESFTESTLGRESPGSRSRRSPGAPYLEEEEPSEEEFFYEGEFEGGGRAYYDDEDLHHYDEDPDSVWHFEESMRRGSERKSWQYRSRAWTEERAWKYRPRKEDQPPSDAPPAPEPPSPGDPASRLKQRYRILARRLHPDLNTALSAEEARLWHRVQAAYQDQDLDQLDLLIALSDAFSGRVSDSTTLHQLRGVAREIERLLASLKRQLLEARQNRAWNFSRLKDRSHLHRIVEEEYRQELRQLRRHLDQVETQLRRFTSSQRHQPERDHGSESPFRAARASRP